ncbi:MAG: NADPH:quinone oxidoreductase family protein [Pseudomonadota bacterium]
MKALVCSEFGPPSGLSVVEQPTPEPGPEEVRIKVLAAGLNFPDLLLIMGQYQVKPPLPFIPGLEAAGVVDAVGAAVQGWQVGDRVMTTVMAGAFAEYLVVPARALAPTPEKLDDAEAAAFLVTYSTAYHALHHHGQIKENDLVLVLGAAGGVGSAAIELARAAGAQVIAAASSGDKLVFAESLGAAELINYASANLKEEVKTVTAGQGADIVFDPVGGDLAQQAMRSLAWHGRYLVIGFASGDIPAFPANLALLKEAAIVGVWWGTWASRDPAGQARNLKALGALVESGAIRPRVADRFPLEEYEAAFACLSGRSVKGKVVFELGG